MNVEERLLAATRAAAETVDEIRELELPAFPARAGGRQTPPPGHWRAWAAPVVAAVAVIALAVSLVIVKEIPKPIPASPAASVNGVPRYYVALKPGVSNSSIRNALVVGDVITGSTLATIQPPPGRSFFGVTGAADDRTFVVDTLPVQSQADPNKPRTWYLLRLAPGTATPARLTRLALPSLSSVSAVALSRSGDELAVASGGDSDVGVGGLTGGPGVLRLYSVATGKLLRTWTSSDQFAFDGSPGYGETSENNGDLTWVADDHAIAFLSVGAAPGSTPQKTLRMETLHVVNLAARGDNLLGDSRVIWSQTYNPAGCTDGYNVLITADLKTIVCLSVTPPAGYPNGSPKKGAHWTLRWLAYSTSAPATARTLLTAMLNDEGVDSAPVPYAEWISTSGKTIIAEWYSLSLRSAPAHIHIGAVSNGQFTPLPIPVRILSGLEPGTPFGLRQSFGW